MKEGVAIIEHPTLASVGYPQPSLFEERVRSVLGCSRAGCFCTDRQLYAVLVKGHPEEGVALCIRCVVNFAGDYFADLKEELGPFDWETLDSLSDQSSFRTRYRLLVVRSRERLHRSLIPQSKKWLFKRPQYSFYPTFEDPAFFHLGVRGDLSNNEFVNEAT